MKDINDNTMRYFFEHDDESIRKIAKDTIDSMFEYAKILCKGLDTNYYSGDIEVVQAYDRTRKMTHDLVISRIGILNRLATQEGKDLLLNTDNMTREDIADSVVMYCTVK